MITNKNNEEIRLISIKDLCRHCMGNTHEIPDLSLNGIRWQCNICSNNVPECDGYTLNTNCPMWAELKEIILLNV